MMTKDYEKDEHVDFHIKEDSRDEDKLIRLAELWFMSLN